MSKTYDDQDNRNPEKMHRERSLVEYEQVLHGINKFIKYIKTLNEEAHLLDTGTGSGKALKEIKENNPQIKITGVDRVRHKNVDSNLGDNFIESDVADMKKVESDSIDGVLAVNSIAYANKEEINNIIAEISRVMKVGGIIKGSALHPFTEAKKGLKLTTIDIAEVLEKNGFVAVSAGDIGRLQTAEDVFIAIKVDESMDEYDIRDLLNQLIIEE